MGLAENIEVMERKDVESESGRMNMVNRKMIPKDIHVLNKCIT